MSGRSREIRQEAGEVLTPDHPRWAEFVERLGGEEGCNFREDKASWRCGSEPEKPRAEAILRDMGGVDVDESLVFFDLHGGHCDCQILFNVEADCRVCG